MLITLVRPTKLMLITLTRPTRLMAIFALSGLLVMAGGACRSTKKIRKAMTVPAVPQDTIVIAAPGGTPAPVRDLHADSLQLIRQTLDQIGRNRVDFRTFSAHMKVHYEGSDGKSNEVTADIHIKRDSIIWVNINIAMGITAFRMLITPDSVKILDKIKHIIRLRSVSYLQDEVHLPVDFKTLQDLLMGNPIFLDTSRIAYYKKEQGGLSLFSVGTVFTNYLTLNPGDYTLRHSKLDDTDPLRVRTCDVTYGDYEQSNGTRFSTYRKISVSEKSRVDVELSYKQYKFNEPLSYSFSIPKNYKRR
jgi:hypothetical protein